MKLLFTILICLPLTALAQEPEIHTIQQRQSLQESFKKIYTNIAKRLGFDKGASEQIWVLKGKKPQETGGDKELYSYLVNHVLQLIGILIMGGILVYILRGKKKY